MENVHIYGMQKLTLLDYPGKTACTLFLGGCNFRCPYCHNSSLCTCEGQKVLPVEEVLDYLTQRKKLLDGVCICGGEPLLQAKLLLPFLQEIKKLGYLIKLDTNGSDSLALERLLSSGMISYVAMDVKNSIEHYPQTIGNVPYQKKDILDSIRLLQEGIIDYEFRTTVVKELHTIEDFRLLADLLAKTNRYYLQPYKDSDAVFVKGLSAPSTIEMKRYLSIVQEKIPNAAIRG